MLGDVLVEVAAVVAALVVAPAGLWLLWYGICKRARKIAGARSYTPVRYLSRARALSESESDS